MIYYISIDNLRNINTTMNFFRDYTKDLIFLFKLNKFYFVLFLSKLETYLVSNNDNSE